MPEGISRQTEPGLEVIQHAPNEKLFTKSLAEQIASILYTDIRFVHGNGARTTRTLAFPNTNELVLIQGNRPETGYLASVILNVNDGDLKLEGISTVHLLRNIPLVRFFLKRETGITGLVIFNNGKFLLASYENTADTTKILRAPIHRQALF